MTDEECHNLMNELKTNVNNLPPWGRKQNQWDKEFNPYKVYTYAEAKEILKGFPQEKQNYQIRRWFNAKCAECDEYLFSRQPNVERNPNRYDKIWDFKIDGNNYDLKRTNISTKFNSIQYVLEHPEEYIKWLYESQSKQRFGNQNRIFLIIDTEENTPIEKIQATAWKEQNTIIETFVQEYKADNDYNITFTFDNIEYQTKAQILFLIKTRNGFIMQINDKQIKKEDLK